MNNIVYYVDKQAKFYYDMRFIEKIHIDEYNTDVYKCEILMNKYKFNDSAYSPNFELKGKIDIYSIKNFVNTLQEAEEIIK